MNIQDVVLDQRIFALFKGDPKSGKSIAAASFPKPYFFDNDGRMKSVANYWVPRGKTDISFETYTSPYDVQKKLEEFEVDCPYKTLVYDGITTGSRQIFQDAKTYRGRDENGNKDKSAKRRVVARVELTQIEDYDAEVTWFDSIITNLQYLSFKHNINVIVTAHVLTTEHNDIKGSTTISRTLVTKGRKAAATLPVNFDEIYHFDVQPAPEGGEPRYTVVTRNTGWDYAGTALPIPTRIDFTNGSLYDKILTEIKNGQQSTGELISL